MKNTRLDPATLRITPGSPELFPRILTFLDAAFEKPGRHWFVRHYPHIFNDDPRSIHAHHCAFSGDQLVGIVGIYPFSLRVGEVTFSVAGIGSVAVDHHFRGCGIMSNLLRFALDLMTRKGYDLSWLTGLRSRYERYGWFPGGRSLELTVMVKDLADRAATAAVKRATAADISRMNRWYSRLPNRVPRSRATWSSFLNNRKYRLYVSRNDRGCAYLALDNSDPCRVLEVTGTPALAATALREVARRARAESLLVTMPATYTAETGWLMEIADQVTARPAGLINIINPDTLWRKACGVIDKKLVPGGVSPGRLNRQIVLRRLFGFPELQEAWSNERVMAPGAVPWWISPLDSI